MVYTWSDFVGNVGVALIILAYLGLQLGKLDGRGIVYSAVNGIGAALILVSLVYDFNLSAFVIEIFWIAIGLIGAWRWFRGRRAGVRP